MAEEATKIGITNTTVWSRGVDLDQFSFVDHDLGRPLRLLTVGRVSHEKRMDRFCSLDSTKYNLTLVGDGPQLEDLKLKYPKVRYTGALKGADLASEYQKADVFVFTSESDTFGLVMLESIACGTPVAALPVRGPIDVLEQNLTGYMDWNLESAINNCIRLSRKSVHEASKKYSWKAVTDRFIQTLVEKD